MRRRIAILALCAAIGSFFISVVPVGAVYTEQDSTNINLIVEGCNNNGICEAGIGENTLNCPIDCPVVSTSTPPVAPAPGSGSGSGSTGYATNLVVVYDVVIDSTQNSATITWKTRLPTLSLFSWGTTFDYELGTISEVSYSTTHSITVYNLLPGTVYYFKISPQDVLGRSFMPYVNFVLTEPSRPFIYPENANNFKVIVGPDGTADLTWINPTIPNFDYVRVLISQHFYPTSPTTGKVVYEGSGQAANDPGIMPGNTYYYTIFVKDDEGRYSSGRVARLTVPSKEQEPPLETGEPIVDPRAFENAPFASVSTTTRKEFGQVTSANLEFFQNRKQLPLVSGAVQADANAPLSIRLSVSPSLSQYIKTVAFRLRDPHYSITSYIMEQTTDLGVYEAIIPAERREGKFEYAVSLYERIPDQRRDIRGQIIFKTGDASTERVSEKLRLGSGWILIFIFILLFLIFLLLLLWKRRKKDEEEEGQQNLDKKA